MAYDIYIGNAEVKSYLRDDDEYIAYWRVPLLERPDAPEFPNDEFSAHKNCRFPSYLTWKAFLEEAGLWPVFTEIFLADGERHCMVLKAEYLGAVRQALANWKQDNSLPPGFGDLEHDAVLGRLLWLEWWMDWAIANCERPALSYW